MNRVKNAFRQLSRFNVILVIALVVQLILTIVVFIPRTSAGNQSQGPLLKDFNPDSVTSLTIHDKNNASQLVFTKDASGNWVLPSADNYPISTSQVTTLLSKIKALDTNRLIAQNPSSQNRLEVAPDTYERLLEIKQGDKVDKLYVGSSQGTNSTNMRVNDDNQIFLAAGMSSTDASTTLSSWFDTPYFTANDSDIVQVAVADAQGNFQFNKSNNVWTWTGLGKGQTLNTNGATSTLEQVASIQITTPLGKTEQDKYGMKTPLAVITVTTQQSITLTPTPGSPLNLSLSGTTTPTVPPPTKMVESNQTLTIGAKQGDGNYVVKSSASPYYVEISSTIAESFTKMQPSDLITPPATPTATLSAAPTATQGATAAATSPATQAATELATP